MFVPMPTVRVMQNPHYTKTASSKSIRDQGIVGEGGCTLIPFEYKFEWSGTELLLSPTRLSKSLNMKWYPQIYEQISLDDSTSIVLDTIMSRRDLTDNHDSGPFTQTGLDIYWRNWVSPTKTQHWVKVIWVSLSPGSGLVK